MSCRPHKKSRITVLPGTRIFSLPLQGNFFDPSILKLSKIKKMRWRITQQYDRHPFITLLQGIYSCRWKRYQWFELENGINCCLPGDQIFFPFLVATLCLSFVFLYMWLEAKNDYATFDEYVYQFTKHWFYWSFFLVISASVMVSYIMLLMIIGICLLAEGQQLYLHWCNKIGALLVLSICILAFLSVNLFYEEKWKAAEVSLQMTAPYVHLFGICMMVVFSWPIAFYFAKLNRTAIQFVSIISFLVVLFIMYAIPLGIRSPCLRENKTLGPKPTFIGHRGAPMLAPENTQMAFEKAIEHGATGLETDVTVSYDGVPFLMHDPTLRRTTNIHEILPDFSDIPASMFTWQILETLNSGQWFFKAKPFKFMAPLTKENEEMAKNQSIMKLSSFLRLANKENKLVIFDLYRPPKKHPYRNTWIMKVLEVMINEVGIKSQLVLWLPGQYRSDVRMLAPHFRQVLGKKLPLPDLLRMGIRGLNLAYKDINSKDIKEYEKYGIFTNIYVINEPWLYSLAWCAGVHSVTTNTIQILKNIKSPFFLMTPEEYMRMWILLDLISALVIMIVFFFHWWRQKGWCELIVKKSSPVFPMSGVTGVEEAIEEVQKQNKNIENQEEIPVSSSPSNKTTEYWDSLLEMKREKVKMTRSLSTESVVGSSDEDMKGKSKRQGNMFPTSVSKDTGKGSDEEEVLDMSSLTLGDYNDDASSEQFPKSSVLLKFCCIC